MNPDMIKEPVDIAIDQARIQDAQQLLHFLKQIGSESDNLTFGEEGLPVTLKEEEACRQCQSYTAAAADEAPRRTQHFHRQRLLEPGHRNYAAD